MIEKNSFIFGIWKIILSTLKKFGDDNGMKLSAALAYYTIFSLAPLIIIVISLAGYVFERSLIQAEVYGQITELLGSDVLNQIQEIVKNTRVREGRFASSIIGFLTLFIGATGVFIELKDSLNIIWKAKTPYKSNVLRLLINRMVSFLMIFCLGLLLIATLIISTILIIFKEKIQVFLPEGSIFAFQVVNFILSFGIIICLIAIIFKLLPDAKILWRDVVVGATITAVLFVLGKAGISIFLERSNLGSVYGAAGSLILLLVWVNYSSVILFIGAEFTQVYARYNIQKKSNKNKN